MHIELLDKPFNAYDILKDYQQQSINNTHSGGESIFIGHMRNSHNDSPVSKMFIEHYPGMTEKKLAEICINTAEKYQLFDVLVTHRIGEILPRNHIVLITSWSIHRDAAINATREIIEQLKSTAPFWKKEWNDQGECWVASNTEACYDF